MANNTTYTIFKIQNMILKTIYKFMKISVNNGEMMKLCKRKCQISVS